MICAGQTSWDAAKDARWKQDAMDELHNDDTLWAYAMRVSEELCMIDWYHLNDDALYHLLKMGIFDWKGSDTLLHQAQQAICWGSATTTRCVEGRVTV